MNQPDIDFGVLRARKCIMSVGLGGVLRYLGHFTCIFDAETDVTNRDFCTKLAKMALFKNLWRFVEYSTGVEYSEGAEKNFLNSKYDKVSPKKFSRQSDE